MGIVLVPSFLQIKLQFHKKLINRMFVSFFYRRQLSYKNRNETTLILRLLIASKCLLILN